MTTGFLYKVMVIVTLDANAYETIDLQDGLTRLECIEQAQALRKELTRNDAIVVMSTKQAMSNAQSITGSLPTSLKANRKDVVCFPQKIDSMRGG